MAKLNKEVWKPIAGYERNYEISDYGRVRRVPGERCRSVRILKPGFTGGSWVVSLSRDGEYKTYSISHLVLSAFVGHKERRRVVHIDGDLSNNHLQNLKWNDEEE